MIDVIDYGGGNLGSVTRCLDRLEADYRITSTDNPPQGKNPLLFPGVGAFGAAMANLNQSGMADRIRTLVKEGTPYLGICIGLQVLFDSSEEAPGIQGLGLLPGKVVQFTQGKVPQVGWNWVETRQPDWPSGYVYFVNSYYPQPEAMSATLYQADYFGAFTAAVRQDNITAFQFHPEKSDAFGQSLIERWLNDVSK
jgi:imidazole glycerol-phosphate synthase subunit HisH